MNPSQHILVCTEDATLAKKIRFLLTRDDCEVEILNATKKLEPRLMNGGVSLLIVSHSVGGEDAIDLLGRFGSSVPPAIVLGAESNRVKRNIMIVEDASDTQAIYKIASQALGPKSGLLDDSGLGPAHRQERAFAHRTERTSNPLGDETEASEPVDLSSLDFPSEDALVEQFDASVENDPLKSVPNKDDGPEDQEDITVFDVARYHAQAADSSKGAQSSDSIGLSGELDARNFAKVLYQCWTMEARGALEVAEPEETLTIFFEAGSPIHLESNISGDLLGRNLVRRGVIDEEKYAEAAKLAIERGMTIGSGFVEMGYFSRESLGRELGEDAFERVVRRFAAKSGTFEFQANRLPSIKDRPFRIPVGRVLAEGLRRHCPDEGLARIVGEVEPTYFRLRSNVDELQKRFPISDDDREFLSYSGRAYNVQDASKLSDLSVRESRVLLALLMTCEEIDPFTPGVQEFEARIEEERQRQEELEKRVSAVPGPAVPAPAPVPMAPPPPIELPSPTSAPPAVGSPFAALTQEAREAPGTQETPAVDHPLPPVPAAPPPVPVAPPPVPAPTPPPYEAAPPPIFAPPPPVEVPTPAAAPPPPPPPAPPPAEAPPVDAPSIPPMPEPAGGSPGRIPRPVVFSPPLPRNPDGSPQDSPERTKSREHFQKGVGLLGQGNFDEAEEAFRDAIALCSDEHVYLIGLARALYYNPNYAATGKVPVLRAIVDRASSLAPSDNRVQTLSAWVSHAERTHGIRQTA